MIYENEEKNAVYRAFNGDIDELTDKLRDFCEDLYGDKCEFYKVSIEREKDAGTWKVHEFQFLNDSAVNAVKNHLNTSSDLVRVRFGDVDRDYNLEFVIAHARNTGSLARFVSKEDMENFDEESLVVVGIEKSAIDSEEHRKFLESLG